MNDNALFWKIFARRSTLAFFISAILFLTCILRVAAIATADFSQLAKDQGKLRLTAAKLRGTIYDCNKIPLTNNNKKIIAAVSPTPRAITAISSALKGEARTEVLEKLKKGEPVLCEVAEEIKCDGIVCSTVYSTDYDKLVAKHIIGYTDNGNNGISGLEAAYNDFLYTDEEVSFVFESTGIGDVLEGVEPIAENNTAVIANGLVTTIDINLQNIAEQEAEALEMGAIVIAEAKSGKIRAMVSRPDFDVTNISASLESGNSPLLNRAVNAYNVGSVFKPCVAAAGIESGYSGFEYICTGSCEIIDRFFNCHKRDGHGFINLRSGIAHSCNTYFYNFAFSVGGEKIYNKATALKFGTSLPICQGISTAEGSLPDKTTLSNIAYLANFSIGQGKLSLSPVSMLTLYSAIANGGKYYVPSIVEGTVTGGKMLYYNIGSPTKAMEDTTAALLKEYLTAVLEEGTGTDGKPKKVSAAGKTATAQTGQYENGAEICQGWFCGYFPAEEPEYVAIVFSENTTRQTDTCAAIFSRIADKAAEMFNLENLE